MRQRITWAAAIALLAGLFVQGSTVGASVVKQDRQRAVLVDLVEAHLNADAITAPEPYGSAAAEAARDYEIAKVASARAASGIRVCYWGSCQEQDPPAGVTVANACELVLEQITVFSEGNIAFCGYTEHETNELTIEILDHHLKQIRLHAESMIEILDAWGRKLYNIVWGV